MKSEIAKHYKRGLTQEYRNSVSVTYPEHGYKVVKKGKCVQCSKSRQATQIHYQTISPWNQKTEEEVLDIEKSKAKEWSALEWECSCGGWVK